VHSIVEFSVSASGLALYVGIFIGYLILQQFAINFIRQNTKLTKSRSKVIEKLQSAVILTQYALAINQGLILVQIFAFARYSRVSLFFPTVIGLGLACILFFTFGIQFLGWRRNLRQSLGILLFAISFLVLGAVQIIDTVFLNLSMLGLDPIITPESEIDPPVGIEDPLLISLIDNGVYTDYAAFTLMIFGTALLLNTNIADNKTDSVALADFPLKLMKCSRKEYTKQSKDALLNKYSRNIPSQVILHII